jgi:hypothetical protein
MEVKQAQLAPNIAPLFDLKESLSGERNDLNLKNVKGEGHLSIKLNTHTPHNNACL